MVDQYDGRGELWRVAIAYLQNYYELPTTWSALDVLHDLQARRYHVQHLDNQESSSIDFSRPIRLTVIANRRPCAIAARADLCVVLAKGRYSEGGLCASVRRISSQSRGSALTKHNVTPIVRPLESSLA